MTRSLWDHAVHHGNDLDEARARFNENGPFAFPGGAPPGWATAGRRSPRAEK
ncbi:VOC family protein [Brenneria sp. L4-2C]|nr:MULTISPECIES: VOC family protein [unclassified Brenneria]MDX5629827.1 VOC family protein [Brenneria sp. L3-3Z]MDX5696973.1 VOC family protein [Brenneria sp. L4-2C]